MEYRKIYYREDSDTDELFEFQINFVMGEGSISYSNNDGGYTTRGAKMKAQELEHFKLILNKGKPEQYRGGLPTENSFFKMDEFFWELTVDYTDGTPELQLGNRGEEALDVNKTYVVPAFVQELRTYALAKLGLEDVRRGKNV